MGFVFLAGFGDRLLSELKKLSPRDVKLRVSFMLAPDPEAKYLIYFKYLLKSIMI